MAKRQKKVIVLAKGNAKIRSPIKRLGVQVAKGICSSLKDSIMSGFRWR